MTIEQFRERPGPYATALSRTRPLGTGRTVSRCTPTPNTTRAWPFCMPPAMPPCGNRRGCHFGDRRDPVIHHGAEEQRRYGLLTPEEEGTGSPGYGNRLPWPVRGNIARVVACG